MKAIIRPTNIYLDGYSVTESVNQALADGNVTSTLSTAQVSTAKEGIFYATKQYEVDVYPGRFRGISYSTDDSNGMGLYPQTPEMQTLISLADPLNKRISVPPFKGSLPSYVQMLLDLTGAPVKKQVYWSDEKEPWTIRGYSGNVYEHLNQLCTYHDYEVVYNGNRLVVRPSRRYVIENMALKDTVSISYQRSEKTHYVDVSYYPGEWSNKALAYPVKPTDDNKPYLADSVMSVNNNGMDGDVSEQTFDIDVSLKSIIREAIDQDYPDSITCQLPMAMLYTPTGSSSKFVMCYVSRGWKSLGIDAAPDAGLASDYILSETFFKYTQANTFSLCIDNQTFYLCTVAYDPNTDSPAQWVQWALFNGDEIQGAENLSQYQEDYSAPPYSYYTVVGSDDMPIMPTLWNQSGGRLEVTIEPETDRIKFVLTGPDIHYDVPIYTDEIYFPAPNDGDTVAFDLTGHFTEETMYYVATDGQWVYDESIAPFPYSPYRICLTSGGNDYNGLFVVGTGVAFTREVATYENTRKSDIYEEDSRSTIDMMFIDDATKALSIGARSLRASFTGSANLVIGDEIILRNYTSTSYDGILDFILANETEDNAYDFDNGTYEATTQWWKNYLGQNTVTYDDITNAVKDGSVNIFGNIAGSVIDVPNRATFRILDATISQDGVSVSFEEDTRFVDMNRITKRMNKDLTLGDLNEIFTGIQLREHLGTYTLGMLDQEPERQVV